MRASVAFEPYVPARRDACLALFDANCPAFFAPGERAAFAGFLDAAPAGYEVCLADAQVVGAFGLIGDDARRRRLNWILVDPDVHGLGIGSAILARVAALARAQRVAAIDIAASHRSAAFFARAGASVVRTTDDGWAPGMHRVDMEWRL